MNHVLPQEEFEGAKELAEIGRQIAEGRALLGGLESSKAEFVTKRGDEVAARIKQVLVESEGLITQIGKNHDGLVKYRREVTAYVADLRCFIQSVNEWVASVNETVNAKLTELGEKEETVRKLTEEEKKFEEANRKDHEDVVKDREELGKEIKKYRDDKARLKQGFIELKIKQK